VRAAEAAARINDPAEDALPLVEKAEAGPSEDWDADPGQTSIAVFAELAAGLGEAFGRARSADRLLFGFAEHDVSTVFLGTSTGLRLRHTQPTGRLEINGKSLTTAAPRGTGRPPATSPTSMWPRWTPR